jgi:hypothetical protein
MQEVGLMMEQSGRMDMNLQMQRLRRLATLDTTVFDEVRGDTTSTIPAVVIAVVSTFLFGLGGWLWWAVNVGVIEGDVFLESFLLGSIISIILWGVWVGVTYVMLTQLFRARADVNELIRVMGFAAAPLALGVLMFLPLVDFGVGLTVMVLFFGTTFLAVQSVTDASPGRALAANTLGFMVWAVILALFVSDADNPLAPGFFVFDSGTEILRDAENLFRAFS